MIDYYYFAVAFVIQLIGYNLYYIYMINCYTAEWLKTDNLRKRLICSAWSWHIIVFIYRKLMG